MADLHTNLGTDGNMHFTQGRTLQLSHKKMSIAARIITAINIPVQAVAQVFFSPKRSIWLP
jgi:hypothetical protein